MSFHRDKIGEVHGYCPALPFRKSMGSNENSPNQPEVLLFFRERDPVYYVGSYLEDFWQFFYIQTNVKQNFFFAHMRVFPVFSGVAIEKLDPKVERKKLLRKLFTVG